jgi:hypothetical protein
MKTVITLKGNNKQVREFASVVANIIENNPADYSNVITGEPEYTKFYEVIRSFVVLQPDRCGKGAKALISEAKAEADAKEIEYDEITINAIDDYCEDTDEYKSLHDKFHVEETKTTWEIFSNIFGEENAAISYEKISYTKKEAIADYRKNGI